MVSVKGPGHNGAEDKLPGRSRIRAELCLPDEDSHDRHAIRQARRGIALSSLAANLA